MIKEKLATMLTIQDELNQVVDKNWNGRGFNWEDAMMVEGVELFDHLPWKWWKQYGKPIDLEQVKLEAVDIWHFILSRMIEEYGIEEATELLNEYFEDHDEEVISELNVENLKEAVRCFLSDVANENGSDIFVIDPAYISSFCEVLIELGMKLDDLYVTYIAKTQLNRLRWANGYGSTYIKIWDGQEDNVWLASYVKTLDVNAPDFKEQVYAGLVKKYNELKDRAAAQPKIVAVAEAA